MRRPAIVGLCVLGGLAVAAALWLAASRPPGAVLYVGGPILTMDAEDRVVEALATEADRIVAAGSEAELRTWAERAGARIVDLEGAAVLPGFIDAHGHFPGEGLSAYHVDLNSPPIGEVERMDDLVTLLRERSEETSEGDWVVGIGYDDMLLAERRHPTRADLDGVSLRHPIAVLHISGHLGAANSRALELLGIGPDTEDPAGGVIQRDEQTGEPNGVLEEEAMMGLAERMQPSLLGGLQVFRMASARYLAAGVTTAQSGLTPRGLLRLFTWLPRLGLTPLRLVAWPDAEAGEAMRQGELRFEGLDPLRVRVGAVKLVADGSIQGYTGYLRDPYHVPPGNDPRYRGYPRIESEALREQVLRFHAAGLQLAVHGNGDAAIDDILDAFEAAQQAHPRSDARHVIIHAQMTREDQLDRMKALGIVPSFFSLHTFYWGDRHHDIFLGPERAQRISPSASAMARGMRFTLHADSPVVPMEPLRLVASAVQRRTRSGRVLGEAQRIPVMRALRAVTIDAAWQHFEEADKGSLEPGKLADLAILERSPLEAPESIERIRVLRTVIGGHTVYELDEGAR